MTAIVRPSSLLTRPIARLRAADPLLLLLRASLLTLLVNSNDDTVVLVVVAATCAVVLPRPAILRSPWFWASCFVLVGGRQLATWHTIDDHIVATTYWCGALALGLSARGQLSAVAASARLIVGSLFAFAAGWKLLSGEFIDGRFFRYSLLFDDRFETPARLVGGTTRAQLDANRDALRALDGSGATAEIPLLESSGNLWLARTFTGWGAFIEVSIAVAFLTPLRQSWGWLRHATLIAFAVTTYLIVPVGGFGTLLLVLGAAQATSDRLRTGYYLGAIALLVWAGIWPQIFR